MMGMGGGEDEHSLSHSMNKEKEMESIREVMKARDGLDDEEVDEMMEWAREMMEEGMEPEEVLEELFGLEPDYVFDDEFWEVGEKAGIVKELGEGK